MSIEKVLERIAVSLESIAGSLEATGTPSSSSKATQEKPAAGSAKSSSTKTQKKSSKSSSEESGESSLTIDDVRAKLKELQKIKDSAAAREILKDAGVKILKDLEPSQFAEVIAAADSRIADDD